MRTTSVRRSCSSHVLGEWKNIVAGLGTKHQISGVGYIDIKSISKRDSGLQTLQTRKKTFVGAATRAAEFTTFVVLARHTSWKNIVAGLVTKYQFSEANGINLKLI